MSQSITTAINNPATQILAEFSSGLHWGDIPPRVVEHAKVCVLDALGVALFGSSLPWSQILVDTIKEEAGEPQATIWGTSHHVAVTQAVLANCAAGHSFELDDLHTAALIHATTLSVPVALAFAEHRGGTGRDFLLACIAGFEVGLRVGIAGTHELFNRGFHPQGTTGVFSAAASAAKMLGLDPGKTQHALGISASMASGLMAAQEGAMAKRLQSGHAGQAGAFAALLARRGYTGVLNAIEAPYGGFLHCYANLSAQERLTDTLHKKWETLDIGFKPYPTVSCVQGPLRILQGMMAAHSFGHDDIKEIIVDCSTFTYRHTVWPYQASGLTEAQMNMFYCLAALAVSGEIFVNQFKESLIAEPRIMAFMKKISVRIDPEIDRRGPVYRDAVRMTLRTSAGEVLSENREWRPGSPEDPMSKMEITEKFRKLAEGRWPSDKTARIIEAVDNLCEIKSLAPIFDNLRT